MPPSKQRLSDDEGGLFSVARGNLHSSADDIIEYYKFMADRGDVHAQVSYIFINVVSAWPNVL